METNLSRRNVIRGATALVVVPLLSTRAAAQTWLSKPIRFVTGYPAGGLVNIYARAYSDQISKILGQPVIVEIRSGAGGNIAAVEVKRSAPDGHSFLFAIGSSLVTSRVLYKDPGYDADTDFARIAYFPLGSTPVFVRSDLGIKDLKGFIEYARANHVVMGTPGAGSYAHIMAAELNKQFNLKIEPIHYRGETPMFTDFMGGVVHAVGGTWYGARLALTTGKARGIAVTGMKRMSKMPEVGTFYEQGLTSEPFRLTPYLCVLGPAGMPEQIVTRWSEMFVDLGKSERVQTLMNDFGIDESAGGREAFDRLYKKESPEWVKLASSLGLTPL